ncbi:MAG: NUDIX domain-containing protein [Myxococcota bacterium]|nr:NUDIX domain-containing protein [Myxococcota bacterium]
MSVLDESQFLDQYRPDDYPRAAVTVDLVIFTVRDADLKVLLIKRGEPPFKDLWALPGGFIRVGQNDDHAGENLEDAAHRVLAEETGLPERSAYLEQLYTFGDVDRDPRMRVISVAWFALVSPDLAPLVTAGRSAEAVGWHSLSENKAGLAFDHNDIVEHGVQRIRGKLNYAPIAFDLVAESFTIAELRSVHEAVRGAEIDAGNFRRKFLRMVEDGWVEKAPGRRHTAGKPAAVFRFNQQAFNTQNA